MKEQKLKWNIQAATAVFKRDVRVFIKDLRGNLIRIMGHPFLFLTVFGFLLPKMKVFRANYTQMLIPGIVAMAALMGSMRSVAAEIGLSFDHNEEIRAHILLPLSVRTLAAEKIIFGMVQGLFSGFSVLIVSGLLFPDFFTLNFLTFIQILPVLMAGSIIFASLGLAIGTTFTPPEVMFEIMFIIMMPMMFFGATFYPVSMLEQIHSSLSYVTLLLPLAHVSELLRVILADNGYFPTSVYILGIIVNLAVLVPLGIWAFKRRAIS
ncbi:MAG: ABC transporter permease [Elusimicrobiota bacterium]